MKKTIAAGVLMILATTGCVTAPTIQEKAAADYGTPPANYQATIKDYLGSLLKDPGSAQIKYDFEPRKDWSGIGRKVQYGYAVCAHINSKNSFGGYTGQKRFYFLIRDDQVVASLGDEDFGPIAIQQQCNPNKAAP